MRPVHPQMKHQIETLLRDAEPLATELTDPAIRRRRDVARDELIQLYRAKMIRGEIETLDKRVRLAVEELQRMNGGLIPKAKGGRPQDQHNRLMIWLAVHDAVGDGVPASEALRGAAKSQECSVSYVKAVWLDKSKEWARLTAASISERAAPGAKRRPSKPKADYKG